MPRQPAKPKTAAPSLDFSALVEAIRQVHDHSAAVAKRAVNSSLTLRNWVIGLYLAEYELRGADRAEYGDNLFAVLSARLEQLNVSNTGKRQLYQYLGFYRAYPQIVRTLSAKLAGLLPASWESTCISPSVTGKSDEKAVASPAASGASRIVRTPSPLFETPGDKLIPSLSFSYVELLTALENPLQRAFHEVECVRGRWSVRALKRGVTPESGNAPGSAAVSSGQEQPAAAARFSDEKNGLRQDERPLGTDGAPGRDWLCPHDSGGRTPETHCL